MRVCKAGSLSIYKKKQLKRNEPRHDKNNNVAVRPAKIQISLGIHPVWSESSLYAQWVAKDPSFLHADSEDSDQTGRMPRLIWVFAGRTLTLLVLTCRGSLHYSHINIACSSIGLLSFLKIRKTKSRLLNLQDLPIQIRIFPRQNPEFWGTCYLNISGGLQVWI